MLKGRFYQGTDGSMLWSKEPPMVDYTDGQVDYTVHPYYVAKVYDHEGLRFLDISTKFEGVPVFKWNLSGDDGAVRYEPLSLQAQWEECETPGVYIDRTSLHPDWQKRTPTPKAPRPPKVPKKKLDWRAALGLSSGGNEGSAIDLAAEDTLGAVEEPTEILPIISPTQFDIEDIEFIATATA